MDGNHLSSGYVAMNKDGEMFNSTELLITAEGDSSDLMKEHTSQKHIESFTRKETLIIRKGVKKRMEAHTVKEIDTAWYVFDNLSCDQAEDLLRRHGDHGTYLVTHHHDPESYGLSIRIREGEEAIYKHYSIGVSAGNFHIESFTGTHRTIEQVVVVVQERLKLVKLVPIFNKYNCETHDASLTISGDIPPDYSQAHKYPEAAKKSLPLIVPIRPTLRRMMRQPTEELSVSLEEAPSESQEVHHGCCWKAFHTDPAGAWYKPHKAGPITAIVLIIGWILFIVFFGWIVALALVLVFILVVFAYILNFICTGRCQIEEDD